jgi:DNA-binding transcriptional LysR family regulator
LFDACQPLVQVLLGVQENALDAHEAIAGDVKISLVGKFAEQQLMLLLTRFAVLHPGVRLELDISARNIDLVGEGFHLAVRMGPLESSNALLATRLVDVPMVLLAIRQLLDSLPVVRCPADIPSNMRLCLAGRLWEFVLVPDHVKIIPTGRISSNSGAVLLKAGAAGLGIVNVPAYYVTDAHERNGLVRLFLEWASAERSTFYLVFPAGRHMPLRIRRLIDYLREQVVMIDFNSVIDTRP